MKKFNLKKGRALSATVLGLAAVSLVGVGFSAWVIQTEKTASIENITVSVAEVKNNTVTIAGAVDSTNKSFKLDAASGDNAGDIRAEDVTENDQNWAINITFSLTDAQARGNSQIFKGLSISTSEKQETSIAAEHPYSYLDAEGGNILSMPVIISSNATEMALVDSEALKYVETGDAGKQTFNLYRNGDTITDVTDSTHVNHDDANITLEISRVANGETLFDYTIKATFEVKWGSKYKGFNPSLCDGANEAVNTAFGEEEKPTISEIETDLTNIGYLNGSQINHVVYHDPYNAVEIS